MRFAIYEAVVPTQAAQAAVTVTSNQQPMVASGERPLMVQIIRGKPVSATSAASLSSCLVTRPRKVSEQSSLKQIT